MNKKQTILLFFLAAIFSCDNNNNINNSQPESHIKYFGFSLIDVFWDDPTDDPSTTTNYINEVSAFSNIADILVLNPTDNIVNRLDIMNNQDVKAYLHISELFFEQSGTNAPSGTNYNLRTDYQQRWNSFVTTNNLQNNTNKIQAFYVGEEPTWNGISFTDLKTATDYIKSTLSQIPILIVEAYPALNELIIPTSVDWVAFDHYFIKDPKNDLVFLNELTILKSKLSNANQKIVFIIDTHFIQSIHEDLANISLLEMKDVFISYYELAKTEPKTIALIGYFWPSGFDDSNSIGARNMPTFIREEYQRVGQEITQK
ncbi:hypothetical protein [Lacinutrix salivirga]